MVLELGRTFARRRGGMTRPPAHPARVSKPNNTHKERNECEVHILKCRAQASVQTRMHAYSECMRTSDACTLIALGIPRVAVGARRRDWEREGARRRDGEGARRREGEGARRRDGERREGARRRGVGVGGDGARCDGDGDDAQHAALPAAPLLRCSAAPLLRCSFGPHPRGAGCNMLKMLKKLCSTGMMDF